MLLTVELRCKMTNTFEVDIWYGDGDCDPIGPLQGKAYRMPDESITLEITDADWLDNMGWKPLIDGSYTYSKAPPLGPSRFVRYDGYAWSLKV